MTNQSSTSAVRRTGKQLRKLELLALALCLALSGLLAPSLCRAQDSSSGDSPPQAVPVVTTDQADYAPGTTATITGSGFQPDELVTLQVFHADGTAATGDDHLPWDVVADEHGFCRATWHVCEDDCVGSILQLTATGEISGSTAQATFSDSTDSPSVTVQSSGTGCRVLVLVDVDNAGTTALINALTTAGYLVTRRAAPEYTWNGSNPSLANFDVVVHLDGFTWQVPLPISGQGALVNFVANGGGFIGSQWDGFERAIGQQTGMNDLVLQLWQTGNGDNFTGNLVWTVISGQQTHPVLVGIPNSFAFFADGHDAGSQVAFGVNPSTVLMRSQSGGPSVLVRQFGLGRVVNFSAAANFNGQSRTLQDGNIQKLYVNAVAWACTANANQPPVAQCKNVTVAAGANCSANASIEDGSFDPDVGDTITLTQSPPGPYSLGTTTVTLTVTDSHGASSSCTTTVTVVDTTPPVPNVASLPTIHGQCSATIPSAPTATDNCAGTLKGTTSDSLTYKIQGTFVVTWKFDDGCGNTATQTQTVIVQDTTKPSIVLKGAAAVTVECHTSYTDEGATASDNCDGDLTSAIITANSVDANTPGTYAVTYNVSDVVGNAATQVTRKVTVVDTTSPVPDLASLPTVTGQCSATVVPPTATDACDGPITATTSDPLSYTAQGTYTVHWTYSDIHGNQSTQTQAVKVQDTTKPVISLNGAASVTVECHAGYTDAGATAKDNCDGNLTGAIVISNPVNANVPGIYTVTYNLSDTVGNAATQVTRTVTVVDTTPPAPDLASLPTVTGECSAAVVPPTATDACNGPITATTPDPLSYTTQGTYTVHWTYSDIHGNQSTQTQTVIVQDTTPPFITCPADKVVNADPLVCSAIGNRIGPVTAGDNCSGYTVTYTLSGATTGSGANDASGATFNPGVTTVTYTITDIAGLTASCSFNVTVVNPNPVVTLTGPPSGSLYAVNSTVNFTATFTDAGGGTHSGIWTFDNISEPATILEPNGATPGSASARYTFTAAGVYSVKLRIDDSCQGSSTADRINNIEVLVVVYDPSAGFVTGGGWINSPAGAYAADPTLSGKANFGFVSKYQKGATKPTGETEFQFQVANFNFHSSSYDWLVVSGPLAQYKGSGTINGAGDYGFLLTATDGQVSGGGGVDKFRIKISNKATGAIVYDNAMGASDDINSANPRAIAGGSIVIQKTK